MIDRIIQALQYLPTIMNSVTVDDYILFDKTSLMIQCVSGTIDACYRGLGL